MCVLKVLICASQKIIHAVTPQNTNVDSQPLCSEHRLGWFLSKKSNKGYLWQSIRKSHLPFALRCQELPELLD